PAPRSPLFPYTTLFRSWNVAKMLNAMGAALDYYRAHYGPYQFNYARIVEFPGYASYAQAFAGTMPYSESIGFNADTNDPTKIDRSEEHTSELQSLAYLV